MPPINKPTTSIEIGVRYHAKYGRNLGCSIEFNSSLLASGKVPAKYHNTNQIMNTNTMGIENARCVRATIQPVTVWVSRIINRLAIDSNEILGIGGSPICRKFCQRKSQRALAAPPLAIACKARTL